MASSNIKLFDENKGNMLSDSEFNISNQRMNGLQTGVASSQLQNKAMYQASLVAYAIAQIMLQNGLNANDTDAVSAFVANLSGTMLQKVYDIATTAEAQAAVATGKWMSPALTKEFFDYRKATTAEAKAGTNDAKWMSPALVKAAIDTLAAKAQNILSDTTKSIIGMPMSSVPDDVFLYLVLGRGKYAYSINVKFPWGDPYVGATVTGGTTIDGGAAVTDENGKAVIVAETNSITIGVDSPYFDVASASNVVVTATKTLTEYTLVLERKYEAGVKYEISSSITSRMSPNVDEYDLCLVGGGGGGTGTGEKGAPSGGGGYVKNVLGIKSDTEQFTMTVGGGGAGVSPYGLGGTGGTTSFVKGALSYSAGGGTGAKAAPGSAYDSIFGTGNGNGANYGNGTDGSGYIFEDESLGLAGGGGGGAGNGGKGGLPYGGDAEAGNGKGPGGGGAGIGNYTSGGSGYRGTIYMRLRYKRT